MQKPLHQALVYIPTYTPEAMVVATRSVAGVPPILRNLMTLTQAGIKHVVLLVEESQKVALTRFMERFPSHKIPSYTFALYEGSYQVGKQLFETLQALLADQFLCIDANLLYNAPLAKNMHALPLHGHDFVELEDGNHSLPCSFMTRQSFFQLKNFVESEARSIESCLRFIREQSTRRPFHNSTAYSTFLLKRLSDIEVAEKFLCEHIRLSTHGMVAKYLNKRISLPLSLFFSKVWLKPNIITTFNLFIGILSGVFVANGQSQAAMILGTFLFQAASVLDGCDGEVAKLTFRFSKYGGLFDTICDYISLFCFIVGLFLGHWNATHSWWSFAMCANLLVSVAGALAIMAMVVRKNSRSASLVAFEQDFIDKLPATYPKWIFWMLRSGKFFVKKDFFSLVALVLALFGKTFWWLYAANVLALTSFLLLAFLVYHESRRQTQVVSQLEGVAIR